MGRYTQETGGGDFQQAPVGTHVARCIRLIDLGTQTNEYEGKETKRNQVLVMWELCYEMMESDEGAKPFIVSRFYTNSLNEKATLRHDLAQWRGRDFTDEECKKFDLQSILGAPCMLSVITNEKGKSKVGGVMKMPKGQEAPAPKNEPYAFWLDEFNRASFEALSEGIKKIIMKSPEYQTITAPLPPPTASQAAVAKMQGKKFSDMDDDIPF